MNEYIYLKDNIVIYFKHIISKRVLYVYKISLDFWPKKLHIIMSVYFTSYAFIYDLNLYLNLAEDITNYLK